MNIGRCQQVFLRGPLSFGRLAGALTAFLLWTPVREVMAAAGKPATKLVNVADTRGLAPGITKWIGDLYNASDWQFAAMVVVIMSTMGLVLGFGCDRLVGLLGINLGKMKHHE